MLHSAGRSEEPVCVSQKKKRKKKKTGLVIGSPASFLSPHFNSLLEVREMTSREKQGESKQRVGQEGRETERAGRLAHQ